MVLTFLGAVPTIADISLTSYLYYPADEFGFDIATQHKNIGAWLDRVKALGHPYVPDARAIGRLNSPATLSSRKLRSAVVRLLNVDQSTISRLV